MKDELNEIISKMETALGNIEAFQKRIRKVDELSQKVGKKTGKTKGYQLAKKAYEREIQGIVKKSKPILDDLHGIISELQGKKKKSETEKLKKSAMQEVELEINEDQERIDALKREIQKIEDDKERSEGSLTSASHMQKRILPYMPKPFKYVKKYEGPKYTKGE